MNIGLYDIDCKMPNIALMKLSTFHKNQGDRVEWYAPVFGTYDKVYASSVFTWSNRTKIPKNATVGGSGIDLKSKIPDAAEYLDCDYSLYPDFRAAIGFLTRGCTRKCPWCIVPEKEGKLRPYMDIEQVSQGRKEVILLDNNILGSDYGITQIESIVRKGLKVDFNQGIDARYITDEIAKILARVKWIRFVRLALDDLTMIPFIEKAVKLLRKYRPKLQIFVYVLVKDVPTALQRVELLRELNCDPFAQPYRDMEGNEPDQELKKFARWVNHKAMFKSVAWENLI